MWSRARPLELHPADVPFTQALFEQANLTRGQRLLINGAGGAVGGYAVQLAGQAGAIVTATASPGSTGRVRGYGADQIIDHTASPAAPALAGQQFDVVLNLVRADPEETGRLAGLVADGGVFVGTTTFDFEYSERGVRTVAVFMHGDAPRLAELVARVDAGTLQVDVAARRPLTGHAGAGGDAAGYPVAWPSGAVGGDDGAADGLGGGDQVDEGGGDRLRGDRL
ncbi:MAG TPA: zinc-binding dehydrogenase, partial [Streptosporangiaceae bacterium]